MPAPCSCFVPLEISDLRRAIGPWAHARPAARLGSRESWLAFRTPSGPAALRLTLQAGGVQCQAWGEGAEAALAVSPDLLGIDDRPAALQPRDPIVERLARGLPDLRFGRTQRVFDALLLAICEQRVTAQAARHSHAWLHEHFGDVAPGPLPLRLPPQPAVIARLRYEQLHAAGIERKRAEAIITVARVADRLEAIVSMERTAGWRRLLAVPGVGPWTAAVVFANALGDPDTVPIGDFHLANVVGWALAGEPRATDRRMVELLEPYRGQRGRVLRLLQVGGVHAPALGPRQPVLDLRGL